MPEIELYTQIVEPSHLDFPSDAIYVRGEDLVLRRITTADGKKVLWPILAPGRVVTSQVTEQIKEIKEETKATVPEIAAQFGLGRSTVNRHLRLQRQGTTAAEDKNRVISQQGMPIARIKADFSAMENTQMPYSICNAIRLALGTANTMAVLSEQPIIQAHYQGYSVGFQAALAIICGAAGIDLSFLEVEHDDKSSGTNNGT